MMVGPAVSPSRVQGHTPATPQEQASTSTSPGGTPASVSPLRPVLPPFPTLGRITGGVNPQGLNLPQWQQQYQQQQQFQAMVFAEQLARTLEQKQQALMSSGMLEQYVYSCISKIIDPITQQVASRVEGIMAAKAPPVKHPGPSATATRESLGLLPVESPVPMAKGSANATAGRSASETQSFAAACRPAPDPARSSAQYALPAVPVSWLQLRGCAR